MTNGSFLLVTLLVVAAGLIGVLLLRTRPRGDGRLMELLGQLTAEVRTISQQQEALRGEIGHVRAESQQATGRQQVTLAQSLAQVQESLSSNLATAQTSLWQEIHQTRELLATLKTDQDLRAKTLDEARGSIQHLERIIAGTKSRGMAGENILAGILSQLPPEIREVNLTINGKQVEFALRLPHGKVLPIDSKWTSVTELEELATEENPQQRKKLLDRIQKDVREKVKEVTKYLDPDRTIMLGVVAVPDAVYELCTEVHTEAYKQGVVVIGYTQAIPYLLSLLQLAFRYATTIDTARLSASLKVIGDSLERMEGELEGRFARALVQLSNSRDELRQQLGRARQETSTLSVVRPAPEPQVLPAPEELGSDDTPTDCLS